MSAPGAGEQLAYSVPHAAQVLDLSDRKVWALVQSGEIASILIGRSRRITRPALLAYIEKLENEERPAPVGSRPRQGHAELRAARCP